MACYSPLTAYRAPGGQITFNRFEGWVDRPLKLKCGQCIGCRQDRTRDWAVRCMHQLQMDGTGAYITLTYDREHLPDDFSLDKNHWKKFAKRLRKKRGPFKYFHCGEYGDQNLRPHYHACLFGIDFTADQILYDNRRGYPLYVSPELTETWGMGHCTVGNITYESAAYVAQYVYKKRTKPHDQKSQEEYNAAYERIDQETGEVFSVEPEYCTMSRNPGLGTTWIKKYYADVYPLDEVIIDGRKFKPPRFYDERIKEDLLEEVLQRRRKAVAKSQDNTPQRLEARRDVALAKLSTKTRDL